MPLVPPQYIIIGAAKVAKARAAFDDLVNKFAGENVVAGITAAGKTKILSDAFEDVARYGSQGSLWEAYVALENIKITPEMAPFFTEDRKQELKNQLVQIIANL